MKLLGAIAVLAALVAGCGSDEPTASSTPAPTATPTPDPAAAPSAGRGWEKGHNAAVRAFYGGGAGPPAIDGDIEAEYHQPPRPATGGVGDTITLTGTNIGVRLRATVTGLVDPARATESPRSGMRYVGVGLRLRSTGIAIHDTEIRSALLRWRGGSAKPVLGVTSECSNGFEGVVRIEVGLRARGCLLFEVPESARPRQLQFALEVVPAAAGGRWRLR
jgi:hypothetical protein